MTFTSDNLDRQILHTLQDDGRIPVVDLANRVGLSATPCTRRLNRLEESGLIAGYSANIDRKIARFGITAFVSVELEHQSTETIAQFQKSVA